MNTRIWWPVLALLAGFVAPVSRAQEPATGLHWFTDYEEARAEARRTEKPIFLEFRCAP